jgi:stearoyl-CoA desaturase (delta-9 desaturase)
MYILIFFVSLWYASLFCQSFFQHRYAAHGAFQMSARVEKLFFILSYIAQGSSYMSPKAYAILHRMHHAYTDTELDPHSPLFSKNLFAMMWRTRDIYLRICEGSIKVEQRFTKNLPEWPLFDRWANSLLSRVLWAIVYVIVFAMYASSPWLYLLLIPILVMSPVHGAIINWFAHKYGYTNFKLKNASRNLISVDILMLGESYHNNHHKYPSAINFGRKWHEIDPIYPVIKLLAWLKIVKLPNVVMRQNMDNEF